ncbi:hypothetical protein [Bordetella genomosp. 13]|uniref:HPt domain-containing protein n=1 Tax=Bordetella genomosp. 13 TaxID=463040 RepID=A0A1W6ZBW3_9BORD|nr:hypothetical protein [Bordetella genomosp. 13]ARP94640.1 hypothetical protein CAL15_09710 [Bordetella genomosp. 13]
MPTRCLDTLFDDGLLDLPRLRVLCPDPAQMRRLLTMAVEHMRVDHQHVQHALLRGDPLAAAQRLHHIQGAVCMLCVTGHPLVEQLDDARAALLDDPHGRRAAQALQHVQSGLQRLDAQLHAALQALQV